MTSVRIGGEEGYLGWTTSGQRRRWSSAAIEQQAVCALPVHPNKAAAFSFMNGALGQIGFDENGGLTAKQQQQGTTGGGKASSAQKRQKGQFQEQGKRKRKRGREM